MVGQTSRPGTSTLKLRLTGPGGADRQQRAVAGRPINSRVRYEVPRIIKNADRRGPYFACSRKNLRAIAREFDPWEDIDRLLLEVGNENLLDRDGRRLRHRGNRYQ